MRKERQRLGAILTLLCFTGGSACFLLCVHGETAAPALRIGSVIPDAPIMSATGETRSLHQVLHGRCLLIVFNTACHYCRDVIRDLLLWQARRQSAPPAIGLSLNDAAETWSSSLGNPFPVFTFPPGVARRRLGIRSVPAVILLEDSVVRGIFSGTPVSAWDSLLARTAETTGREIR